MHQNFGARMRRRREEQGIALASIAEQTKIKASLLEALERDDVSHWPSGIFRRAYIRAYAQAIGLDPDVVVRDFLELHPEPVEEFETALASALSTGVRANSSPPTRLRNIVGSALDSLSRFRRAPALVQELSQQPARPALVDVDLPVFEKPELHLPEIFGAVAVANDHPLEDDCVAVADVEPVVAASVAEHRPPSIAEPAIAAPPATVPPAMAASPIDLVRLAEVCTAIGSLSDPSDVQPMLNDAARLIDASGLIVWIWDDEAEGLRPAMACGYSSRVLVQLPTVKRHADNATAAAFRTASTCVMRGGQHANAALAVPLMAASGCIGVLALEVPNGMEQEDAVRSVASIVAAMIALWVSSLEWSGEVGSEAEAAAEQRSTR